MPTIAIYRVGHRVEENGAFVSVHCTGELKKPPMMEGSPDLHFIRSYDAYINDAYIGNLLSVDVETPSGIWPDPDAEVGE